MKEQLISIWILLRKRIDNGERMPLARTSTSFRLLAQVAYNEGILQDVLKGVIYDICKDEEEWKKWVDQVKADGYNYIASPLFGNCELQFEGKDSWTMIVGSKHDSTTLKEYIGRVEPDHHFFKDALIDMIARTLQEWYRFTNIAILP